MKNFVKHEYDEIKIISGVNNYGTIPVQFLRDTRLSLKTWGLLAKIFSIKQTNPDWKFSVAGLTAIVKEGRDTVLSCLKELQELGYLYKQQERNDNGSFGKYIWYVFETPELNPWFKDEENTSFLPKSEKPNTVKTTEVGKTEYGKSDYGQKPLKSPKSEKPNTENPTLNDIDIDRYIKKENLSKEKESVDLEKTITQVDSQISLEMLKEKYPDEIGLVTQIRNYICELMTMDKEKISCGKTVYQTAIVKSQLKELNYEMICYVIDSLKNTSKKITNMRSYLFKVLINAQMNYEAFKLNDLKIEKSVNEKQLDEKFYEHKPQITDDEIHAETLRLQEELFGKRA